jgi:hypothetical protein
MGKYQTQNIEWISFDQQCLIEVTTRMREEDEPWRSAEGRVQYEWGVYTLINEPNSAEPNYRCVGSSTGGDPIMSGAIDEPNALEGLKTLSSFVEAWIEACEYEDRTQNKNENSDLFPTTMWELMSEYHDELYQDTHMDDLIRDVEFWSDRIGEEK